MGLLWLRGDGRESEPGGADHRLGDRADRARTRRLLEPAWGTRHLDANGTGVNVERGRHMYIGGGVVAVIIVVLLLLWLF